MAKRWWTKPWFRSSDSFKAVERAVTGNPALSTTTIKPWSEEPSGRMLTVEELEYAAEGNPLGMALLSMTMRR